MSSDTPLPDKILNTSDMGNDVQRRYRYQAAYAALLSISLLDEESEFKEVFCEQYEDILVKRKDAKFIGVQVKTRNLGLGPFKFNDSTIMEALERFIKIEKQFPGKFVRYIICSNCGFWQQKKDFPNLIYCLELIRKNNCSRSCLIDNNLSGMIAELSTETKCDEDFVLNVLCKVNTEQWSDLDRYEIALIDYLC